MLSNDTISPKRDLYRPMAKSKNTERPRARIVKAAAELFYLKGIRGVTVDAIAAHAKTTKMAIYRHFSSKDALIVEWLSGVTEEYSGLFDDLADRHPDDAAAQLIGLVTFVADSLDTVSHRGCPFVNSIAELPKKSHPARRLIERHKMRQAARLEVMCTNAKIPNPELAAAEITFLLEGAQIAAQNNGIADSKRKLLVLIEVILSRAKPRSKREANGVGRRVAEVR